MSQKKKTRFEHLMEHILKWSVASDFDTAKSEWELYRIKFVQDYGKCPCTKEIKEHCYIVNKLNGNKTHVGNVCIKQFMKIEVANRLFAGLKRIQSNPSAKPNMDLIEYAMKNGFLYGDNEYEFLQSIKKGRKLSDEQAAWIRKINRRIVLEIEVQRLPDNNGQDSNWLWNIKFNII